MGMFETQIGLINSTCLDWNIDMRAQVTEQFTHHQGTADQGRLFLSRPKNPTIHSFLYL
jgi:hypothetical protein